MEIYLTRMKLNPLSRRVRSEIGNLQELHKTISGAFPAVVNPLNLKPHERETPRNKFDILHRLEINARRGEIVLLVQSTHKPDWSKIVERGDFLIEAEENLACKEIGANYAAIENGMMLQFRLQANPTKRVPRSDAKADQRFIQSPKEIRYKELHGKHERRRRVELIADENETLEEKQIKWLKRKGEEAGFRLANVKVAPVPNAASVEQSKIKGWRNDSNKPMTFGSVLFEGILTVTDAEKFRETLTKGIGQGKAYGFGLLSVAKVSAAVYG